ncbi:MAG: methyl-accepting chemotaxis protein [Gemmatimonadales bacterium]
MLNHTRVAPVSDPSPPRLDALTGDETERRLRDLDTLTRAQSRRWILAAAVTLAGLLGAATGSAVVGAWSVVMAGGAATVLNALAGIVIERRWHPAWLVHAAALLDIGIAALPVVWFGPGGFAVGLLMAVLPYAADQGATAGALLAAAAGLVYTAAAAVHAAELSGAAPVARTAIEAAALVAAGLVLIRPAAGLRERIRRARGVMSEAEQGYLAARAPAAATDELGLLEQGVNRMLDEIALTVAVVQRDADEFAASAGGLASAAGQIHTASQAVGATAGRLAVDLGRQRATAEGARGESAKAADQAEALRQRAEMMQVDSARLAAAAERGRERAGRAMRTLRAVGEEVRATAASVAGLSGLSERIGAFAQAIARIARQTHLLALNAAIEAARAEEHGEGFAVVADEVRALAAEAGRSAREVAELVGDLRAGIDAAARAMQSGEGKVRDIGEVAAEADGALQELHQGVQLIGDLVNSVAEVSRSQAQRLADLARSLEQVSTISAASYAAADGAADITRRQVGATTALTGTTQQLAQLAERLRAGIARFSVLRRDQRTAEHRIQRTAAD